MVRWLNEALCTAWDAWVAFAEDRQRMIRLGRLVLGRYANALQSKCLLAWFSFAADAIESRQRTTAQALQFLSGRQELVLRARFDAWAKLVDEARQRREAAKRSVIVRVRNRHMAMAWQAWFDMHLEVGRAKKAANLWVDGAVSKAWRTWDNYVYQRKRMQTLARLMVARFRDSLLARVFFNWAYVVRMDRSNREEVH